MAEDLKIKINLETEKKVNIVFKSTIDRSFKGLIISPNPLIIVLLSCGPSQLFTHTLQ